MNQDFIFYTFPHSDIYVDDDASYSGENRASFDNILDGEYTIFSIPAFVSVRCLYLVWCHMDGTYKMLYDFLIVTRFLPSCFQVIG